MTFKQFKLETQLFPYDPTVRAGPTNNQIECCFGLAALNIESLEVKF